MQFPPDEIKRVIYRALKRELDHIEQRLHVRGLEIVASNYSDEDHEITKSLTIERDICTYLLANNAQPIIASTVSPFASSRASKTKN